TNANDDYNLDADGFSMSIPNNTLEVSKSLTWMDGNSVKAQIGAANDTIQQFSYMEYKADNHAFRSGSKILMQIQQNLVSFREPPVVPRITTTERKEYPTSRYCCLYRLCGGRSQLRRYNLQ